MAPIFYYFIVLFSSAFAIGSIACPQDVHKGPPASSPASRFTSTPNGLGYDFESCPWAQAWAQRSLKDFLPQKQTRPLDVLSVGTGSYGAAERALLRSADQKGVKISMVVCELSEEARKAFEKKLGEEGLIGRKSDTEEKPLHKVGQFAPGHLCAYFASKDRAGSYDVVMADKSLHFLTPFQLCWMLDEIEKCLRPGGLFLFSVSPEMDSVVEAIRKGFLKQGKLNYAQLSDEEILKAYESATRKKVEQPHEKMRQAFQAGDLWASFLGMEKEENVEKIFPAVLREALSRFPKGTSFSSPQESKKPVLEQMEKIMSSRQQKFVKEHMEDLLKTWGFTIESLDCQNMQGMIYSQASASSDKDALASGSVVDGKFLVAVARKPAEGARVDAARKALYKQQAEDINMALTKNFSKSFSIEGLGSFSLPLPATWMLTPQQWQSWAQQNKKAS